MKIEGVDFYMSITAEERLMYKVMKAIFGYVKWFQ